MHPDPLALPSASPRSHSCLSGRIFLLRGVNTEPLKRRGSGTGAVRGKASSKASAEAGCAGKAEGVCGRREQGLAEARGSKQQGSWVSIEFAWQCVNKGGYKRAVR